MSDADRLAAKERALALRAEVETALSKPLREVDVRSLKHPRTVDALVAVHIFGWTKIAVSDWHERGNVTGVSAERRLLRVPRYSSDTGTSEAVIRSLLLSYEVVNVNYNNAPIVSVSIYRVVGRLSAFECAEEPALAICRAALLAVTKRDEP